MCRTAETMCSTPGCINRVAPSSKVSKTGTRYYLAYCYTCQNKRRASAKGMSVYQYNRQYTYLKHRKTYCENIDGRLGFTCTTNVVHEAMLDTDHINGNPSDNAPENLQTLCKCCHAIKTMMCKDGGTPGRGFFKKLKQQQAQMA